MKYFSGIIWQVVFVALLTVFSYSSLADQQWNQDSSTAWRGTSDWKDKAEKNGCFLSTLLKLLSRVQKSC